MAVFKCKMCGGALEITNNETVVVCEYCGTKQTLPKLDDDRKANLYDRANHFRRNNEFDKAMGIYEQILNDDNGDAETYWSLVLCRYGIEYVEDPATRKRIPTVNRAQFTSVFDDEDYKSALKYADGYQKEIYEQEAKVINDIQKGILAISSQEDPFDVFICYKESDANGRRTPDSVLATELYHELVREGYKVFFSRITLEDKLGQEYEPYIFAALNSAKAMVVLGTKSEYFNAVWVKNEWSRYLALIKNGARKMLIPAYKDMDPYDLPEEFSHLQAQDMSKLGFMQDLIRGIKKIVESNTEKKTIHETIIANDIVGGNVSALLKRGYMALEDGEWDKADDFFEQCLNQNAELAEAYLGKLMAELQVTIQDNLKDCAEPFNDRSNYQKAIRFANENLKNELVLCVKHIEDRNEGDRLESIYNNARSAMNIASTENGYKDAAFAFESIVGYKNSANLSKECYEKAEVARKDNILLAGVSKMRTTAKVVSKYEEAIRLFESIPGWKYADEKVAECRMMIEEIKAKEEADCLERERQAEIKRLHAERIAKRNKKITLITTLMITISVAFLVVYNNLLEPRIQYNKAIKMLENGNIVMAYDTLMDLNNYRALEKAESIYGVYKIQKLKAAKVGDYVFFGAYEQDNNATNGKEEIEWLVLDKKGNNALLISKYALDCKAYNTNNMAVTWETCSLRTWLNNDFVNSAFSEDESAIIPTVTVSAGENTRYNTNSGNATQDKVFLLSINEASKYFSSDGERKCEPTDYVAAKGIGGSGCCDCWLRSPGGNQGSAAFIKWQGGISESGRLVTYGSYGVRPALWIDIGEIE